MYCRVWLITCAAAAAAAAAVAAVAAVAAAANYHHLKLRTMATCVTVLLHCIASRVASCVKMTRSTEHPPHPSAVNSADRDRRTVEIAFVFM